ncbi:hypothetical protein AB6T85_23615 [Erwinia sp. ACCC 02193]|uniref:Uncharacterized protein n=1 Tax=Erwinia aeris TaxID=3239803 RepID=A0ABV4EEN2_9GAMM
MNNTLNEIPADELLIGLVLFGVEASSAATATAKEQRIAINALFDGLLSDMPKKKRRAHISNVTDALVSNGALRVNPTSQRLAFHNVAGPFTQSLAKIKAALAEELK